MVRQHFPRRHDGVCQSSFCLLALCIPFCLAEIGCLLGRDGDGGLGGETVRNALDWTTDIVKGVALHAEQAA